MMLESGPVRLQIAPWTFSQRPLIFTGKSHLQGSTSLISMIRMIDDAWNCGNRSAGASANSSAAIINHRQKVSFRQNFSRYKRCLYIKTQAVSTLLIYKSFPVAAILSTQVSRPYPGTAVHTILHGCVYITVPLDKSKLFISRSCLILILTTVPGHSRHADVKKSVKNYTLLASSQGPITAVLPEKMRFENILM